MRVLSAFTRSVSMPLPTRCRRLRLCTVDTSPAHHQQLDAVARAPSGPYHRAIGALAGAPWAPSYGDGRRCQPRVAVIIARTSSTSSSAHHVECCCPRAVIALASAPSTCLHTIGALVQGCRRGRAPSTPSSAHPRHPHPCEHRSRRRP